MKQHHQLMLPAAFSALSLHFDSNGAVNSASQTHIDASIADENCN